MTPTDFSEASMPDDDRASARALTKRIEQDGAWAVSDACASYIVDARSKPVAGVCGEVWDGRNWERDAADIIEARRLVPVLAARIDRGDQLRADSRAMASLAWKKVHQAREQVDHLRAELGHVERDEEVATRGEAIEGARCECCGRRFRGGEQVAVFTADRVVMCYGPCPEPDVWRIVYVILTPAAPWATQWPDAVPFEDAWVVACDLSKSPVRADVMTTSNRSEPWHRLQTIQRAFATAPFAKSHLMELSRLITKLV